MEDLAAKRIVIGTLGALLAGCGTLPSQRVEVPIPIPCISSALPARPVSRFGAGPYPGGKAAAQLALQDGMEWEGYAVKLEALLAGCVTSHAK